jgi:hypothetical protein
VADERRERLDLSRLDTGRIVWFDGGPRDPEPCSICAVDTRATPVKRAWFCGCVFDADGNAVVECDCPTNELLVCGPCLGEACEGVWIFAV